MREAAQCEQERESAGPLNPTRRTVLAGLGVGTVAGLPSDALAAAEGLRIEHGRDEAGRHALTIHYRSRRWPLRLFPFGPDADFAEVRPAYRLAEPSGAVGQSELVRLEIRIVNASFLTPASRYEPTLRFTKEGEGSWTLSLRPGAWLEGHAASFSTPVDLDAFLAGEGGDGREGGAEAPPRPTFHLTVEQAKRVRERLFGERLEVLKPVTATFSADGTWTFRALRGSGPKDKPAAPQSIVVLKGGGYIDDLSVRIVEGGTGPGASLREFQVVGDGPRDRSLALLGTATFVPAADGLVIGDRDESELVLVPKAIKGDGRTGHRFALRHRGQAEATMAMLRASFSAYLRPRDGRDLPTARFVIADGLLTRQRDLDDRAQPAADELRRHGPDFRLRHRLRGAMAEDPQSFDTPYGRFDLRGDPIDLATPGPAATAAAEAGSAQADPAGSKSGDGPRTEAGGGTGPVRGRLADFTADLALSGTMARIETDWDRFSAFELRATVTHYALALADAASDGIDAQIWSRLDFTGTETAFVFARLRRDGLVPEPVNARGVVEIGGSPALGRSPETASRVPVEIALDGAKLRARRAADLLALEFGFAGLALQVRGGKPIIVQAVRRGLGGAGDAAASGDVAPRQYDDRARLIVTFPPQHVAERAYLRRVDEGVRLPVARLSLAENLLAKAQDWRTRPLDERVQQRTDAQKAILVDADDKTAFGPLLEALATLTAGIAGHEADFGGETAAKALKQRWDALPADQKIYLGTDPLLIDPDARATVFAAWKARQAALAQGAANGDVDGLLQQVPDVALDPALVRTLLTIRGAQLKASAISADSPAGAKLLTEEKERQDESFGQARIVYDAILANLMGAGANGDRRVRVARDEVARLLGSPDKPAPGAAWGDLGPILRDASGLGLRLGAFRGREDLKAAWQSADPPGRQAVRTLVSFLVRVLGARIEEREAFEEITPAYLSGPSRLVFHVDGGYPPPLNDDDRAGRRPVPVEIDFSLSGLTQWGRFDLAVTRRAQRLYRPDGGRLRRPDLRRIDGDPANLLAFQGIREGRSLAGRLEDVRTAAGRRPDIDETAIELPFRLVLSPSQEGRFRTPHAVPTAVFDVAAPPWAGCPVQVESLWSATLETGVGSPDVRAVDSPDFQPDVFLDAKFLPERGPWAPWSQANGPDPETGEWPRFRTGLDASDRHELVGLTSVHGMPVLGRIDANNQIIDPNQFAPPPRYRLKGLATLPDLGDQSAIYRPQALDVSELRLTALGGSLALATDFAPPIGALDGNNEPVFPGFTIERWRQRTVLGRDIETEVVYKGYLFPLGVRASLVKLTERRFVRHPDPLCPMRLRYTAFLIQRFFVRVGRRTKAFPAIGQAAEGRRFPCRELTMLTVQTPDILDPDADPVSPVGDGPLSVQTPSPSGRVTIGEDGKRLPGRVFWPRTAPGSSGTVAFEFEIDGQGGPVKMPLLFVDNVAANDRAVLEALQDFYNVTDVDEPGAARRLAMNKAPRRYAEEIVAGDCTHETELWDLRVEGRIGQRRRPAPSGSFTDPANEFYATDALLQGAEQPPFYPFLNQATVRIGSAERFVGRPLPSVRVGFHRRYVKSGFDRRNGRRPLTPADRKASWTDESYLELVPDDTLKLDMGEAGDQSGGFGRPVIWGKILCRQIGLVSSDAYDAATGPSSQGGAAATALATAPAPAGAGAASGPPNIVDSFFRPDAKFLGLISFKDLIRLAVDNVPEMKEATEAATTEVSASLKQTVVPKLESALAQVDQAWAAASAEARTRAGADFALEKIYPTIGPALADLRVQLATVRTSEGVDLVVALNATRESARRFAQAVERTAADPIAPLKEALRARFRDISQGLVDLAEGLRRILLDRLEAARTQFLATVRGELLSLLAQTDASVVRALILQLPIPPGLPAPDPNVTGQLDTAVNLALGKFVNELLAGSQFDLGRFDKAHVDTALRSAAEELERRLREARDAAIGDASTAFESYRAEVATLAVRQLDAFKGALFDRLFGPNGWIIQLVKLQADMAGLLQDSPRDLLDRVGPVLSGLAGGLVQTIVARQMQALDGLKTLCTDLARQLHAVSGAAALSPARLASLRAAAADYLDLVAPDDKAGVLRELDGVIARYRAAADGLGADAGTFAGTVCKAAGDLPAAAITQVLNLRQRLLQEIRDIVGRPPPAGQTPNPSEQAKTLKALLTQTQGLLSTLATPAPGTDLFTQLEAALLTVALAQLKATWPDTLSDADLRALLDKGTSLPLTVELIRQRLRLYQSAAADIRTATQAISGRIAAVLQDPTLASNIPAQLDALKTDLAKIDALAAGERLLLAFAGEAIIAGEAVADRILTEIAGAAAPLFGPFVTLYDQVIAWRRKAYDGVKAIGAGSDGDDGLLAKFLGPLRRRGQSAIQDLLLVPVPDGTATIDADGLTGERRRIAALAGATDARDLFANVTALADAWQRNEAAIVVLGRQISAILTAILRGDLAQIIDLQDIRRQMEAAIREMIPRRIARSYTLDAPIDQDKLDKVLNKLIEILPDPNRPDDVPALRLTATGEVGLGAAGGASASFTAQGTFPAFRLWLLPDTLDVVKLTFAPSIFTGGSGQASSLSLRVVDVELGEAVAFLKDLQNYLASPKDGSGFFLRLATESGRPGVTAGYGLALSPISVGNMYISNVSLSCAAELPFDNGDARFVISCGRQDAPLLISAAPYAGAGYFGLIANPAGIVGFEASFEFGGGGGFSFGPLTGEGRITVGIFVRQVAGRTNLYGMFFAGGAARLACFSLSASLLVRLEQTKAGNLNGEAVFTYSFSVGITDFSFSVRVAREEKGSNGAAHKDTALPAPSRYAALGPGIDDLVMVTGSTGSPHPGATCDTGARLRSRASCKGENWRTHNSYFDLGTAGAFLL